MSPALVGTLCWCSRWTSDRILRSLALSHIIFPGGWRLSCEEALRFVVLWLLRLMAVGGCKSPSHTQTLGGVPDGGVGGVRIVS